MTITPVPVRPAPASPGARDDRPAGDPEDFAALVSRETDRLAGTSGAPARTGGSEPDGGTADAAVVEMPADGLPAAVAVPVDGLPTTVPVPVPDAAAALTTTPRGDVPQAQVVPEDGAATAATLSVQGDVALAGSDPAVALSGEASSGPDRPVVTTPAEASSPGLHVAPDDPAPAGPAGPRGAHAVADEAAPPTMTSPELARPDPGATSTGADPAADVTDIAAGPGSVTPASAGTKTGEAAPTAPPARSTAALLDQVTPTLTRLVSRGDGEHRMTLKIHPADLGEMHLTVTVRGERVDVDIAASAEARELLRDGLTQLRALLDPTGRGGAQLVFRDLPQAAAGQPVAAETGTGDLGGRSGSADGSAEGHDRRGQPGGPVARTPVATDAAPQPASAPARSPGAGTRTVDLTI